MVGSGRLGDFALVAVEEAGPLGGGVEDGEGGVHVAGWDGGLVGCLEAGVVGAMGQEPLVSGGEEIGLRRDL